MEDLEVSPSLTIPASELNWRFDTSGGPGGQHANRSSTRVELSFDIAASSLLDEVKKARVLEHAGIEDGVATVRVSESRSQWRNRQIARRRLADLLNEALRPPSPPRKRTRPSRAARERRLAAKRTRSETKRLRRRPGPE